jgi:hypothetical protein
MKKIFEKKIFKNEKMFHSYFLWKVVYLSLTSERISSAAPSEILEGRRQNRQVNTLLKKYSIKQTKKTRLGVRRPPNIILRRWTHRNLPDRASPEGSCSCRNKKVGTMPQIRVNCAAPRD